MDPLLYHEFLNASFRRSGLVIYQPVCTGCRACMPVRLVVDSFHPSKSQRRCRRKNQDLKITVAPPAASDEKYELYLRYQSVRHGAQEKDARSTFENFLYRSPVQTVEFTYRDPSGALVAIGICDACAMSLSSVYFYYDPSQTWRGLGNYGALCEIEAAADTRIPHYYLGYWVQGCRKMEYKADFRPCEALCPDGCWRPLRD
jgi:arginine-tRNA-protein transferase